MDPRHRVLRILRPFTTTRPPPSIGTADQLERFGGVWHDLGPAPLIDWGEARQVGGPPVDLLAHLESPAGRVGVLELDDALVDGRSGWVTTAEGSVLRDHTLFGSELDTQAQWMRLPRRTERLHGTAVVLASDYCGNNFAHGLVHVLPRLELFEAAGLTFDDVDHVLCNASGLIRSYLLELGVPASKILWTVDDRQYRPDRVITTTFPGPRLGTSPRSTEFLHDRLGRPADRTGRRIHLPRFGQRRIANESELEPLLHSNGFETIVPGSDPRDMRPIFAAAEVVVGAHGAALANTVFCPPGTKVLELVPTDQPDPFFFTLARSHGLEHRFMSGLSASHRSEAAISWSPSTADFHVDPAEFGSALHGVLAELPT